MARSYIYGFSAKKITDLKIKSTPGQILEWLDQFFKSGNAQTKKQGDKNYFWARYSKIIKDNPNLEIKKGRVKQIIDELCEKGVLEKYDNEGEKYTKLYLHINYEKLLDSLDDDFTQIAGSVNGLQFYLPGAKNFYCEIKYNAGIFIYQSPAIQTLLVDRNAGKFKNILLADLKLLLSGTMFDLITTKLKLETIENGIKLTMPSMTKALMEEHLQKIERAVVDSYTTLLISQNFKTTRQPKIENQKEQQYGKYSF